MRTLLLNLRHVPDDEANDVRVLLGKHGIAFYETAPNRWGISAGAIWIAEDAPAAEAKRLLAVYQNERRVRARSEYSEAKRNGSADTWWSVLRQEPLRVVTILIAIACVIAISLWPFMLSGA